MAKAVNLTTEMAAHLRGRIKVLGIKARVSKNPANDRGIRIDPPKYGIEFSEDEQRAIRNLAINNGLTLVRGLPIIIEQMTDYHGFSFYLTDTTLSEMASARDKYPSIHSSAH